MMPASSADMVTSKPALYYEREISRYDMDVSPYIQTLQGITVSLRFHLLDYLHCIYPDIMYGK